MRRLTILVALAATLYSAYWYVGATKVEAGANDALAQMVSDGWSVQTTKVATRGYPSRFDTTVTDLNVTSPDGAFAYTTPFVQGFALSYKPTEVIVVAADTQQVRFGAQTIDIVSDGLRASTSVSASTALALKEATAEVSEVTLTSNSGWVLRAKDGLFALRPTVDQDRHYDVYLGAKTLQPDGVPPLVDLVFDSTISLDRPLDRHLLANVAPQIETIEIKKLEVVWDSARLTGSGRLIVDGAGIPTGDITFNTTNWQALVPLMVKSGMVAPQFQFTLQAIMQTLAGADGTLSLPLRFEGGGMFLGPIPIGDAPRLR